MNATLTVNDVELYYTRWGNEGDMRIMLVHGWTGSNELLRDFRFASTIVCLDSRKNPWGPIQKQELFLD